jgi:DNA-directed RNA polymerase delta subunit
VILGGSDPKKNFYTQLVRGTRKFVPVSPNTFGLREFYPNLPKKDKKPATRKVQQKSQQRERKLKVRDQPKAKQAKGTEAEIKKEEGQKQEPKKGN